MPRHFLSGAMPLVLLIALVGWPGLRAAAQPTPEPFRKAEITEHLGDHLPFDIPLTNSDGESVRLGDYFERDKPVIITMVYYKCPMLCPMLLNGLTQTLKEMEWVPGENYEIVTVSFDPTETPEMARASRATFLEELGKPGAGAGWHFHVAEQPAIDRLTEALGFNFYYDEMQKDFAHQAALFVATPEGAISRYLYGIQFEPRDVRLALLEAGKEHIGSTLDKILLFCYHYDPDERSFTPHAQNIMRAGGL